MQKGIQEMFLYQLCFVYSSVLAVSADQTRYTVAQSSFKLKSFGLQIKHAKHNYI